METLKLKLMLCTRRAVALGYITDQTAQEIIAALMIEEEEVPDVFPMLMIALWEQHRDRINKIVPLQNRTMDGRFRSAVTDDPQALWFDRITEYGRTTGAVMINN
jgi:hypothetical protein